MYAKFDKKDRSKLSKLRVSSLLDLALIVPNSYENNFLSNEVIINSKNILDITVISSTFRNKNLQLNLFCNNLNCAISGFIFHATGYHTKLFKPKERMYVKGKVERSYGSYNIVQPVV